MTGMWLKAKEPVACSVNRICTHCHTFICQALLFSYRKLEIQHIIRESVDSLCRDGADAQYMQHT